MNLETQLFDDCGNPANTATVIATFSNGDPPLTLVNVVLQIGVYDIKVLSVRNTLWREFERFNHAHYITRRNHAILKVLVSDVIFSVRL